jgi:hypothetical protein
MKGINPQAFICRCCCFRVGPVPIPESQCADAQRLLLSPALDSNVSKVLDDDSFLIEMMDRPSVPER